MQIKKWWSATMIKGKQCQLKPYLLDGVPQWASATVRIRRRDWLSQGKDWLERLEPSRHERLPLALFFDIVRKMALPGDRRQRRVQPLKISLRLQTQCVCGGGGASAPYLATCMVGDPKWCFEAAIRDPCQGSCATCRIECRRPFTTTIVLHPLSLLVRLRPTGQQLRPIQIGSTP
jgi:hypothetical protein